MGHLTNPTGFRVGRTARWAHRWSSDKFTYFKYFTLSQSIYNYLFYFFKLKDIKFGMMFSHVRLLFALKTIFIRVYLYSRDYLRLSKKRYVNFISRARFYFVRKKRSLLGNKLLLNDATNRKTNKFKKKIYKRKQYKSSKKK